MTGGVPASVAAVRLAWRAAPGLAAAQVASSLLAGAAPVLAGLLTKLVLDHLLGPATTTAALVSLAAGLATAGVLVATLPHVAAYVQAEWQRATALVTQDRLHRAVNRQIGLVRLEDPAFRDRLRLAEEAGRTSPVGIASGGCDLARAAVTVAGFLVVLATLSPWMVLVVAVAAVPTARAELRLSRQRAEMLWRMSPSTRRQVFYSNLLTGLDTAKEVRLFGLAGLFGARMLTEMRTVNREKRRFDRAEMLTQAMLGLAGAGLAGAGLVWAVLAARGGALTVGDVAVFVAAVAGVQAAVAGGISRAANLHHDALMFGHFQHVVDAAPDLPSPPVPVPATRLRHGIELRDVWFRYSPAHPWILRGVDLTIPAGATIALVGLNGAGKSTLVKLLLRFYDPERGSVRWDGTDLRDLCPSGLRERIGATFQDFSCYDLSAAENVGLGDVAALGDLPRIRHAAGQAGADEALAALPHGYQTQLTRLFFDSADRDDAATGVLLSGGQWQRVALARSFMRANRDLMILDEPSAGLDPQAEYDIHRRLGNLRDGATTLLISHRLSAVRDADRIVVLSDGRVAEMGSHPELVDAGGAYSRLFSMQAEGYREVG